MKVPGLAAGRPLAAGRHLRGGQKEAVGLGVHAHGARSGGRLDHLLDLERTGLFGGDGEGAVSRAGEDKATHLRQWHPRPRRWERGVHLAGFIVHHHQTLRVAAADEEAMAGCIDRHADRMTGGRDRPALDDRARLQVHDGHHILVFQIDEDLAAAVGGEKLRRAAKLNGGQPCRSWGRCPGRRSSARCRRRRQQALCPTWRRR